LDENEANIIFLVLNDRHLTIKMIAEELNININSGIDFKETYGNEESLCKVGAQELY
jgi:hypothetical protein